ncbi:MAG TPA: KH domain-containing protein [Myxococcaceae bacterium]|nr:KH domain-containing protein [Myxococcaceae bacterium]
MHALIDYVVRGLVDAPESVEIARSEEEGTVRFELTVAPGDLGKVIGRDGRTVHALRTLVSTAAQAQGKKASLELVDARKEGASQPTAATPPEAS